MTSRDLGPQFQESILQTEHPTEHGGGVFPSSLDPRISLWLSPILLEEGVGRNIQICDLFTVFSAKYGWSVGVKIEKGDILPYMFINSLVTK